MAIYRIVVAYDGTDYHGWQAQPNATTVSQTLIDAYFVVFAQKISILGASRTDAGVHALHQVAIVQSPLDLDAQIMLQAWSKALPSDIVIVHIEKLNELIHPHDHVVEKTYAYYLFFKRPLPVYQRFGWYFYRKVDLDLLQESLNVFIGTHDFRSFCTGDDLTDTVRTITSATMSYIPAWQAYRIEIKGKSFLRYMVRRIVGACLEIASRTNLSLDDLKSVLHKRNPCHTLPNAPAKGLILEQILYEGEVKNDCGQSKDGFVRFCDDSRGTSF